LSDAPSAETDPRRWWAFSACLVTLFMTLLDVSIVNVALPSIGQSTGAQPSELQWVVSGYALGFGLVPIIGGRLGDDRGRKRMLQVGSAGFVLTSAVIGFAPNPQVLLVTRVVQGLAGGLINPQVAGIVQNLFPPRERPRAFSLIGALVGIATAAGPVVGGFIIFLGGTQIGWRLTFLINVPVGITAFVLCARWLPTIPRRGPTRRLDLIGIGLLALGLLGVLVPAVEYDSNRDLRWAYLLIPAAGLLALFFWWESGPGRRRGYPLIDTSLFRIRSFADGCTLAVVYIGALAGLPLVLTLFLQEGLGYSAIEAAGVASASAIAVGIAALVSGRLLPRFGGKVLVAGLSIFLLGVTALALVVWNIAGAVPAAVVGFILIGPLALSGLGSGSVTTPNQVLTYADIDAEQGSTAGGMLQTAQRIGIAVGSAVASAVFYTVALGGHPVTGRAHEERYGHAFVAALIFMAALTAVSLLIGIRSVRHARNAGRARPAG
jgi:EmrB/QacA subfamily drug resistance transporter